VNAALSHTRAGAEKGLSRWAWLVWCGHRHSIINAQSRRICGNCADRPLKRPQRFHRAANAFRQFCILISGHICSFPDSHRSRLSKKAEYGVYFT